MLKGKTQTVNATRILTSVTADITLRRQMEQKLREQENILLHSEAKPMKKSSVLSGPVAAMQGFVVDCLHLTDEISSQSNRKARSFK